MEMPNIEIGRYQHPESVQYLGWIKSDQWVIFIDLEGQPTEPYGYETVEPDTPEQP